MTAIIAAPDAETIKRAVAILNDGGLVAMPTETVYGLAADATNDLAVAQIFAAKGRPQFNPLITHISDTKQAEALAIVTPLAKKLMQHFWPGPLTLVMQRHPTCSVSHLATAGLDTMAIRMPAHETARALLTAFGKPIVAPSANPSGRLSPTTAQHVQQLLANDVRLILEGGACAIGVESTILRVDSDTPILLRAGGLPIEAIEAVTGPVSRQVASEGTPTAPGMLASHYAPRAKLRLNAETSLPNEALLGFGAGAATLNLSPHADLTEAAANLFSFLHQLDTQYEAIAVRPIPNIGLGLAINDRLTRAAAPRN